MDILAQLLAISWDITAAAELTFVDSLMDWLVEGSSLYEIK